MYAPCVGVSTFHVQTCRRAGEIELTPIGAALNGSRSVHVARHLDASFLSLHLSVASTLAHQLASSLHPAGAGFVLVLPAQRTGRPRDPGDPVAAFMSAHSKTLHVTPSVNFPLGRG